MYGIEGLKKSRNRKSSIVGYLDSLHLLHRNTCRCKSVENIQKRNANQAGHK